MMIFNRVGTMCHTVLLMLQSQRNLAIVEFVPSFPEK